MMMNDRQRFGLALLLVFGFMLNIADNLMGILFGMAFTLLGGFLLAMPEEGE